MKNIKLREQIIGYRKQDPTITSTEIAELLGYSRERIRQILIELNMNVKTVRSGRPKSNIVCKVCNVVFQTSKEYRSYLLCPKCAQKRLERVENNKIMYPCSSCGTIIHGKKWREERKRRIKNYTTLNRFCSKKCQGSWAGSHYGFGAKKQKGC